MGQSTTCLVTLSSSLENTDFITYIAVIEDQGNHFNVNYKYFFTRVLNWQRFENFSRVKDIQSLPIVTGVTWTGNLAGSR